MSYDKLICQSPTDGPAPVMSHRPRCRRHPTTSMAHRLCCNTIDGTLIRLQVAAGIRSRRRDAWLRELVPGRPVICRLASLYAGVVLFGVSVALMIAARLGLDPWDVFHQGLARRAGLPIGWVVNGTGVL